MENLKYFLKALALAKSPRQRKSILHFASRKEIIGLSEIVLNYILGNIKNVSEDKFKLFTKYKKFFRILGFNGRKSWIKRKQAARNLGKVLVIFLNEVLPIIYDEV
jgi:preprotein translocase subunit Sec63